jgi:hypothetical protein
MIVSRKDHRLAWFPPSALALDGWPCFSQPGPMPRTMRVEYRGAIYHVMDRASVLTIDTTATSPEPADGFGVAHSAGWRPGSNCPCVSAGRSASVSYILALIPTVHDVIHGPRILDAQLARHEKPLPTRAGSVNSEHPTRQGKRVKKPEGGVGRCGPSQR